MNQKYRNLMKKLGNKEYRESYAFEHIATGIPFQIRRLRKQRKWSQEKLADEAGKCQSWISAIENDDNASFTLQTLREIASAFDVALCVRFLPFSRFLRDFHDVSPSALEAASFDADDFNDLMAEDGVTGQAASAKIISDWNSTGLDLSNGYEDLTDPLRANMSNVGGNG